MIRTSVAYVKSHKSLTTEVTMSWYVWGGGGGGGGGGIHLEKKEVKLALKKLR